MQNVINTIDPDTLAAFNQRLDEAEKVIDKYISNWDYELPNDNFSFFGMSGGVDSSTLAAVMVIKHRKQLLKNGLSLLFCDTGDEPKEALELLDFLEELLGVEIVRIQEDTLFGVLEKTGNYLPGNNARWCTSRLKTDPYNKYLQKYVLEDGNTVNTFVGINASEADRAQDLGIPGIEAYFPFVDCNVTRAMITSIAVELDIMNRSYANGRSRSGCLHCFYMSKPELVSLYLENPSEFAKGQGVELLPEGVEDRISQTIEGTPAHWGRQTLWPTNATIMKGKSHFQHMGTTGELESVDEEGAINWDFLNRDAIRAAGKKRKTTNRKRCDQTEDMFGLPEESLVEEIDIISDTVDYDEKVIYVAVERWYYDSLGFCDSGYAAGIPMKSKLITFSTTAGGLKNSLNGWWYHRLAAAKLSFDTEEQYAHNTHVAVFAIRFDEGIIPRMKPHDGYTWFNDHSYSSIKATCDAIHVAAGIEGSREVLANRRYHSWVEIEGAEKFVNATKDNPTKFGEFVGMGHYKPKSIADFEDSLDNQSRTVRCMTCNI